MRKVVIVPTLLTLGNAVCGLASIAYASRIGKDGFARDYDSLYLAASGWFILAAMIFDTLDGFAARLFKSTGRFGAELDSLCDAISFGVAPAFLLLQLGPRWDQPLWHQLSAGVATLYLMCTILRLARYNVESLDGVGSGKRFRGLPSPAAAGCLASLAVFCGELPRAWPSLAHTEFTNGLEIAAVVGALLVALLMVSRVSYPHLTKSLLRGPWALILAVPAAALLIFLRELAVVMLFWSYAGVGFGRHLWARADARRRALADERVRREFMFTGLIETLGRVECIEPDADGGRRLTIAAPFARELEIGESVAVSGACLTVVEVSGHSFDVQAGPETLRKTTFGSLTVGDPVNLERSLQLGERLGGHLVQGHVDGVGRVVERIRSGEWETVWFEGPTDLVAPMVPKGSVAVDGVSLTLVDVARDRFSVALIPHTLAATTLGTKPVGAGVNLETDLISKYVAKWMENLKK